jgi:hypothetical protein
LNLHKLALCYWISKHCSRQLSERKLNKEVLAKSMT